jgi:hypothetical protein
MSERPDYRSHKEKPAGGYKSPHEPEAENVGEEMPGAVEEDADRGADAHSRGDADKPASEQSREPGHGESGSFGHRQHYVCARHELIVRPPPPLRKRSDSASTNPSRPARGFQSLLAET